MEQMNVFAGSILFKVDKPVRLIELFAGIGAQAKALERMGVDFEHYRICEFDKYAVASYNAVHGTNFATSDITKITAKDLGIIDTDTYCYIMTYSFPCQDLSIAGKQSGMEKGSGTRSGICGRLKGCSMNAQSFRRCFLWKTLHRFMARKMQIPSVNGAINLKVLVIKTIGKTLIQKISAFRRIEIELLWFHC